MVIVADVPALAPAPGDEAPSFAGGLAAFLSTASGRPADRIARPGRGRGRMRRHRRVAGTRAGRGRRVRDGPRCRLRARPRAAKPRRRRAGRRGGSLVRRRESAASSSSPAARRGATPTSAAPRRPRAGRDSASTCSCSLPGLQPGTDPGMPDAGSAGTLPPVFEPAWAAPYRCLAERSGGTVAAVSSPAELEAALRRIAGTLESAVVVRGFHYTGQEIRGISPGGDAGWGATLRPGAGAGAGAGCSSRISSRPRSRSPRVCTWSRRGTGDRSGPPRSPWPPGSAPKCASPSRPGSCSCRRSTRRAGRSSATARGFAAPGVPMSSRGAARNPRPVASTCSFPARLELAPGTYRVRARWKGIERVIDEVTVEAGASTVRAVSFGKENE